ncbi:MAG: NDP-sugar synthase [Candidatus Thermoplasmatota archaeon]|nr:NDP-sugar synthase [Candidatus Thermoplasmatota archaeon]
MLGIIMAGGQGSRLRPITDVRPKPMVEVLGRPVIDFVKDSMVQGGVDKLVVTTGYRGDMLAAHVEQWNMDGRTARINQEATPMGTAGSVRLLLDEITETVIIGSGDSVASFDVAALLEAHKRSGAKATMALWEVEDPSPFGIVGLSTTNEGDVDGKLREGYIRRFKEKPTPEEAFSNVINAGLYILEPEVMALVPEGEKYDFSKDLFPRLLEMGWPMYAQAINGVWFDVGSPSELIRAQNVLIERKDDLSFPIPEGARIEHGSFIDPTAHVQEDATVVNSVIAQHAIVGANTVLKHCVLMNGSKVEDDVHLEYVILSPGAFVSSNVSTSNVILGDNERLENV